MNAKVTMEPPKEVDVLARAVIGAAIEVHRHLGPDFRLGLLKNGVERIIYTTVPILG